MVALDRHMEHVIIHTGQNYDYELNQIFFEDLEIRKPDIFLEAARRLGIPRQALYDKLRRYGLDMSEIPTHPVGKADT